MEPRGLSSIPLPYEAEDDKHSQRAPVHHQGPQFLPGFLRNLKQDDIILIFLIILLLTEGGDCDYLLVAILVMIFLAGFDGNLI